MVELKQIKWEYNNTLNRYYNGCNYLTNNPEQFDKYIDDVMQLKSKIDELLYTIMNEQDVTEAEVLGGFSLV
ncbi:MAG: hypothetical protein HFJ55_02245 [Clostridia bacterium]|nr:hypothetical protein [Clostridia bacterium]